MSDRLQEIRERWSEAQPGSGVFAEAIVQLVAYDIPWLLECAAELTSERDRAREIAVSLEQEVAEQRRWIDAAMAHLSNEVRRVLGFSVGVGETDA